MLRIGNDDADGLGGIHRRAATDGDQVVRAGVLEGLYAGLYVFNGRIWLDIGIKLIFQAVRVQYIQHLLGNVEFDQVRIRTYKSLLEASGLCLCGDIMDGARAVIGCFIQDESV